MQPDPTHSTPPTFLQLALEATAAGHAWAGSADLRQHYQNDQKRFIADRLRALQSPQALATPASTNPSAPA